MVSDERQTALEQTPPASMPDDDWLDSLEQGAAAGQTGPPVDLEEEELASLDAQGAADPSPSNPAASSPVPSPASPLTDARRAAQIRRAEQEAQQLLLEEQEEQAAQELATLRGTIRRIRFIAEDFYIIAELRLPDREDPVTIKGNLAGAAEWCDVELRGRWFTDPKWGKQFNFDTGEILLPSDEKGTLRFLEQHLPTIGPGRARLIVETFGRGPDGLAGVWGTLEQHPDALLALPGLTKESLTEIVVEYRASRGLRDQEVWLRTLNLGPKRTMKVLARFKDKTRAALEADPYVVMDVKGFGFKLADDLAHRIGVTNDHPGRARAALLHVLQEAADGEGHCYLPQSELLTRTDELSVPQDRVLEMLAYLVSAEGGKRLVVDPEGEADAGPARKVLLTSLAEAEKCVAEQIAGRLRLPRGQRAPEPQVQRVQKKTKGVDFDALLRQLDEQEAVAASVAPAAAPALATASARPAPPASSPGRGTEPNGPAPRGPELDREKKLPNLSKRGFWQRSGRAAAAPDAAGSAPAAQTPATQRSSSGSNSGSGGLGALDANTLAAQLGVRRAR